MANPALLQKKNGKYLWFALLGLGLQPDKLNLTAKRINLGPHCWPVLCHKADAEFRKVTCAWLREIMEETANAGSKVVASLFLSPGGPKFVSLMLHLANHVMLQKMKTFTADDCWVPEAAALPASSLDMAVKRMDLIHARFLKAAVDQDRFLQEYQSRAQLLVRSMRDVRAEGAKYDELLKRHSSDSAQEGASLAQKSRKVRSLWSDIDGMLSATKEEQNVVESVLKGDVDQYILDGTDQVLKIPRSLLERIEQPPSGNVYEAGQLNLLSVFELTNHALQLLREECCRVSEAPKPQLSPQQLQQSISKEEIPEVRSAIGELEAAWDRKWMDTLKDTPLVSFLNEILPQPLPAEKFDSPVVTAAAPSQANTSLDWLFDTPPSPLRKAPAVPPPQAIIASVRKIAHVPQNAAPIRTKTQILDMECDNLADQFADAVTTTSPTAGRVKGLDLDGLLGTLHGDPFSTRKQLTRTPESLILPTASMLSDDRGELREIATDRYGADTLNLCTTFILDVKNSWRKAVEEDKAEKMERITKFNDSVKSLLTPLHENIEVQSQKGVSRKSSLLWDTFDTEALDSLSDTGSSAVQFSLDQETLPEMPSYDSLLTPLHENIEVQSQKGVSLKSSLLWDTFDTEALDSLSGTGSSAVQFSLDQETLPEMPSYDSLLSLDDEAVDMTSEDDEELLIPSLKTRRRKLHSPHILWAGSSRRAAMAPI
ncbi:HAUS augmin-like complex subunit 6 [Dissostichus eleginoides]|uniref:HAUS augmin-like complex subunit 6 n=1 Tax=Dissostichus eleginoides TaxID=100907 RepID=A0AAD9BVW6_DISEL|nr:HAUS augmin-like complex subunit 6 [Dissostichus eleginoides]